MPAWKVGEPQDPPDLHPARQTAGEHDATTRNSRGCTVILQPLPQARLPQRLQGVAVRKGGEQPLQFTIRWEYRYISHMVKMRALVQDVDVTGLPDLYLQFEGAFVPFERDARCRRRHNGRSRRIDPCGQQQQLQRDLHRMPRDLRCAIGIPVWPKAQQSQQRRGRRPQPAWLSREPWRQRNRQDVPGLLISRLDRARLVHSHDITHGRSAARHGGPPLRPGERGWSFGKSADTTGHFGAPIVAALLA